MRISKIVLTLTVSALFCIVASAGDVVRDTLGVHSSSVKSVEALLQGQVAGVRVWSMDSNPLSANGISIRGVNSLRGSGLPLFVVDGSILNAANARNMDPLWQYEDKAYATPLSQLAFLSPNDIESIEVLKNTSATALYGSKGANGVVIINTKRVDQDRSTIVWDSNVDVAVPYLSGYSRPTVSHNHKIMVGSTKDRTGYTLSAFIRDDNYLLSNTGSTRGGLRTTFETKANSVVWFGVNSSLAVNKNSSAAATAWYGQESMTLNMRKKDGNVNGWVEDYDDDALEFRAINSMWLTLNFLKGFSFKFDLGTDYQYLTRSFWWGLNTPFGQIGEDNKRGGAVSLLRTSAFSYNASGVFDYQVFVASDHRFEVSAGAQALGNWDVFNTANGKDFYNHSLRAKGLNIAESKARLHKYDCKYFALGIFAALSYDWAGKLGADVAFRTDHTPKYGDWKMYPSGSAFWDIRKTFFPSLSAVSTLRLDGGYGESGREDYIPYDFIGSYTPGPYEKVDAAIAAYYDGRSYLHTKEWNVSLAMGFVDDRITLEAGYYDRSTRDRLDLYCSGAPIGSTIYWDAAERRDISSQESVIANKGIEVSLGLVPVKTKDWNWSINTNMAYNINRVASLSAMDEGGMSVGWDIIATKNIEGHPVSSIVDNDGNILGNPTPEYHGSLGTSLRWKDLYLDVLADGAAGFDILNLSAMSMNKRVAVKENYVEKGDFLRLARVSLGYEIPVRNIKWMKSVRVQASACNLGVLTGYSGWSPDVNSFAVNNFRLGMDNGSYQMARTYVLGLSIKF